MSTIVRIESDYSKNKVPRIPILICIDASSAVENSEMKKINSFLKNISNYILENSECKAKVQLCVVTFSEDIDIVKAFGPVDTSDYDVKIRKGEPDLAGALDKCIRLFNEIIKTYNSESISHYLPELLVLSSGKSSTDITAIAKRLRNAQRANHLSVMPFGISDNDDISLLRSLTDDDIVYTEMTSYKEVFECLKSGLELLSVSSATACATLKSSAIGLNEFIKKG